MKSVSKVVGLVLAMNLIMSTAGIGAAMAGINAPAPKASGSQLVPDQKTTARSQAKAEAAFAKIPMCFEANQGQTEASVKFLARGKGYTLFLTAAEAVLALQAPAAAHVSRQDAVRLSLSGANTGPLIQGVGVLPSHSSYMTGNDQQKWHTNVKQYSQVAYKQVYPGIDLVYYGNQGQLEYDFVLAPGANPGVIRMNFSGAKNLALDPKGNLVLNLKAGKLAFNAPVLYQKTGNTRQPVEGHFVLASNKQVGFEVGIYDKSKELVIDPAMSYVYATYLGGTVDDSVNAIAVAADGTVYLTGYLVSDNFPGTEVAGVYQNHNVSGGADAFVTKISPAGAILWSTYLGGAGSDIGNAIAVDGSGRVHITGQTTSLNFPLAGPGLTSTPGDGTLTKAFVTSVNADGKGLHYSTYLGGAGPDMGEGIAVTNGGIAYVIGTTNSNETTFPQMPGGYLSTHASGSSAVFVYRFDPDGNKEYSTFIGANAVNNVGRAIAIDGIGNVYVTGQAAPAFYVDGTFPNVFKPTITSGLDAFFVKLNPTLAPPLLYVTYIGGDGIDMGTGIALDSSNDVYITGWTQSGNFPGAGIVPVGQQKAGTTDAFVFKLHPVQTMAADCVYSTYLGGSGLDEATAITVDAAGNAYVTGDTASPDFVSVSPLNPADTPPLGNGLLGGTSDAFVSVVSPHGDTRLFKTYIGGTGLEGGMGIGLDARNNIYVGGWTTSSGVYPAGFPTAGTAPMPRQTDSAGATDGFVVKISPASAVVSTLLPDITNVNPAGGIPAGGTTVVITGSGFTGVTDVMFGAVNATSYVVNSNTQITAIAPAHAAGLVDIMVTSPLGSSLIVPADSYTYFIAGAAAPLITGLNPNNGPRTGGTSVIITGTGFTHVLGPNGVKFGTLNATSYTVDSDTQITAIAPAHLVEMVDVILTGLSGASVPCPADHYTYFFTPGNGAYFDPYVFPSPAKGNTADIAYYMTSSGTVSIRVYNEIGNLVDTQEQSKSAGPGSSSLDISKLAPGVYFYLLNLKTDDGQTKKYKRKFVVIR